MNLEFRLEDKDFLFLQATIILRHWPKYLCENINLESEAMKIENIKMAVFRDVTPWWMQ